MYYVVGFVVVVDMKEFCGASQYGCCSDGVTVAQGMQEGCPGHLLMFLVIIFCS